ncbi:MAG: response regulator [Candidatus Latescibacteria bacterium]|jgi:CheY-like chemotaxis protein|nr:response regulator [Candidatus Latescibacterota bacterium]
MEVAVVILLMCLVVGAKSLTSVWIGKSRLVLREGEAEESELLERLRNVESAKLQMERDKEALERHETHLETDKDLMCLEIKKAGGKPISEEQLDALEAAADPPPGEDVHQEESDSVEGEVEGGGDEAAGSEGEDSKAETGDAYEGEPARPRVLVVDDNVELRELLEQALSKNYEVVGAEDGQDAMDQIQADGPGFDVVVTDLKMPNVDGIAFMEVLQDRLPTIVISGFLNRPEFQEALRRMGPVAVLEKPFKMAEMREAIEKAIGREDGEMQNEN